MSQRNLLNNKNRLKNTGKPPPALTLTSLVLFRPESYTDDLELVEGLTEGNGLLVLIFLAERIPVYEHKKYYAAMVISFHGKKKRKKKEDNSMGCSVLE